MFQESFEGQMTEENIEVGICNEAGFKRLTPAEVKDYLAAIAWTPLPGDGDSGHISTQTPTTAQQPVVSFCFINHGYSDVVWPHCHKDKLFLSPKHGRISAVVSLCSRLLIQSFAVCVHS